MSSFNNEPLVEINNLSLRYPFRWRPHRSIMSGLAKKLTDLWQAKSPQTLTALNGIDLKVYHGERVGIVGTNGSGKSTLLKTVAGILPPTSGQLKLRGRVLPLIDIDSGYFPELTGRENLILMGLLLGEPRRQLEDKLDSLIDLAGLKDFADSPVRDYSTGMKARLGFSLVSSLKAEILILDEVLSTTDAGFMHMAEDRLKTMVSNAACTLLVSHDIDLIRKICTRVVWLHQGVIKEMGDPWPVTRNYMQWNLDGPSPVSKFVDSPALT